MNPDTPTRDHWDRRYAHHEVRHVDDDDPRGSAALQHFGGVTGAHVLDLGCGNGEYSLFFARHGARVTALDASAAVIEHLRRFVTEHGIAGIDPVAGDAFAIDQFGPFDFVFGSLILHHLEPFEEFVRVLRRAVRPGGRAFFFENSALSRSLIWCRAHLAGRFGIPKYSDSEEYPLEPHEIEALRGAFTVTVDYPELFLARLASIYLLRSHGYHAADRVDQFLYRFERLHKLSYRQHLLLS